MEYQDYLATDEWRQRRAVAIDWARGACQLCNSPKKPLNVHHRTYDRLGAELPADLVVLCKDCHAKFHDKDECSVEGELNGIGAYLGDVVKELARIRGIMATWAERETSHVPND